MCEDVMCYVCFFSSRRRHTSCALWTGVQTCALPIFGFAASPSPVRLHNERLSPIDAGAFMDSKADIAVRPPEFGETALPYPPALRAWGVLALFCLASIISVIDRGILRSEEHTSELQSLMRISYAVFCLQKKTTK